MCSSLSRVSRLERSGCRHHSYSRSRLSLIGWRKWFMNNKDWRQMTEAGAGLELDWATGTGGRFLLRVAMKPRVNWISLNEQRSKG